MEEKRFVLPGGKVNVEKEVVDESITETQKEEIAKEEVVVNESDTTTNNEIKHIFLGKEYTVDELQDLIVKRIEQEEYMGLTFVKIDRLRHGLENEIVEKIESQKKKGTFMYRSKRFNTYTKSAISDTLFTHGELKKIFSQQS